MDKCKGRKGCKRDPAVKYLGDWMCDTCLERLYDKQLKEWQKKQEKKVENEI